VNYDEGNIKLLVEQVLAELSKSANIQTIVGNAEKAFAESSGPDNSSCSDDGILEDLSAIDIREWFLVKDPIDETLYKEIKATTIARIGLGRAGSRQLTKPQLRMLADHAMAQDSVFTELSDGFLDRFDMLMLHSAAKDKEEYLKRPDLGRILNAESLEILRRDGTKGADVQIIISDGLSSKALEANLPDLLPALIQGLKSLGLKVGMPVFVKFGRVALMDQIGEELKPKAAIILVGERPGLPTAESLSAYFGYNPRVGMVESERTCNSNIHKGQPPSTIAPILSRDVPAQLSSERLLWHQTFFLLIAHCSYQTLLVFLPPPPVISHTSFSLQRSCLHRSWICFYLAGVRHIELMMCGLPIQLLLLCRCLNATQAANLQKLFPIFPAILPDLCQYHVAVWPKLILPKAYQHPRY
jgi:ethanolamine ammonia-lyase small subunit